VDAKYMMRKIKQRKIKIEPGINLSYNIYTSWPQLKKLYKCQKEGWGGGGGKGVGKKEVWGALVWGEIFKKTLFSP